MNPNGTLDESGSGWNGFQSQDLANLISRAHAAGERVVLTVTDFDQGSLERDHLVAHGRGHALVDR